MKNNSCKVYVESKEYINDYNFLMFIKDILFT